jgi:hypothetical protein
LLRVLLQLLELDKLSPDDSFGDVCKMFWKRDKITVIISAVITLGYGLFYFVADNYAPESIAENDYFDLAFFGGALVIGYAGQGIIYKALGKAVDIANRKIEEQK